MGIFRRTSLPHLSFFLFLFLPLSFPLCLCVYKCVLERVCAYGVYICMNPLSMVVFVVNLISIERCQKSLFVTLLPTDTHTQTHVYAYTVPGGRRTSE